MPRYFLLHLLHNSPKDAAALWYLGQEQYDLQMQSYAPQTENGLQNIGRGRLKIAR